MQPIIDALLDNTGSPKRGHPYHSFQSRCLIGLMFLLPLVTSQSQTTGSPQGTRFTVYGVIGDSLRGTPLRNAIVRIDGTKFEAITDSAGRFRIDSVATNPISFQIDHPILDTVGIHLKTAAFDSKGRDSVFVVLSTPSPKTLVSRKCTPAERSLGPAAVIGVVFDADTDVPSEGARVTIAWRDLAVNGKDVKELPQQRVATVDRSGLYRICGLPADLTTGVYASRGTDTTAALGVSLTQLLAIANFHLPLPAVQSAQGVADSTQGSLMPGALAGFVQDSAGRPLKGARVAVEADHAVALTDSIGSFSLKGLRTGTRPVSVRLIGYTPIELAAEVTRDPGSLRISLRKLVPVLKPMEITASASVGLSRVGYEQRKREAAGVYLGPKEIADRNSPKLSTLLETVPLLKRYFCVRYFVDGHAWSTLSDVDASMGPDSYLSGAEIGAVEIYSANTTPGQFITSSKYGACATVVIWTKNALGM